MVHAPPVVSAEIAVPPVARVNCDGFTVMSGLVLGLLLASVTFVAVTVKLPLVFNVTLKDFVPATRAALDGSVAVESLDRIRIVSVAVLIRFQLASTAFTVTLESVPAV